MALVIATLKQMLLRQLDPLRQIGRVSRPPLPNSDPMNNLVTDPVADQARAEEDFSASQVEAGREIHNSGLVETAADEANLRAYQEAAGIFPVEQGDPVHAGPSAPVFMGPPPPPEPVFEEPPVEPEDLPDPMPDPLLKFPGGC